MEVTPINRTEARGPAAAGHPDNAQSDAARSAFSAARQLNSLKIQDREFNVIRDPSSQTFIVVVRQKSTGEVLDQFPPEEILKLLTQFREQANQPAGETSA